MALIEPQNPMNSHKLKFFTSHEYECDINQSIQSLLDSLQNRNPNVSGFTSKFLELIQAKPDPRLETIWVLSCLTFQPEKCQKDDILDQLLAVKNLFQSITAYSAACSPSVSISLIAPVIYKLCTVVNDLNKKEVDLKKGKKVRREIRSFVDVILGYFNVCTEGSNANDEGSRLITPLKALVSIWVQGEENGIGLNHFFPLLSEEIIVWVSDDSGSELGLMAGAVIVQAFLLKLCLKFSDGTLKPELQNELRSWAVCSITVFRNFYFYDILVKMLLEPNLPVMSLLSSEDESLLRKVLYDVVILPDYTFLHLEKLSHLPVNHIKDNILARLMVTHEAIELFRKNKDHQKAIFYANAFSESRLPTFIMKLVTSELGTHENTSQPKGSSLMAILKWVLDLEDQCLTLTDGFMSKYRARFVQYKSTFDLDDRPYKINAGKKDDDLLFVIDNKGNDEDENIDDCMNDVIVDAARTIPSDTNESGKKRKGTSAEKKKNEVKFQRYNLADHLGSRSANDDSGSASGVEDSESDEDSD